MQYQKKPIFDIDNVFTYETWLPEDLYELAGLAQHYGVPTRLLDWSQDIFVSFTNVAQNKIRL